MQFSKEVRDPVHGWIHLTKEEANLIDDSMYIQRLRYVAQLGLVYLTYPTAKYTRFDHSLGVMHLAHRMAEEAVRKMSATELRRAKEGMGIPDDGVDQVLQHVRLAALHHDVGHLPLSHTLEGILSSDSGKACGAGIDGGLFGLAKEHEVTGYLITMRNDFQKLIENNVGGINMDTMRRLAFPKLGAGAPLHSIISSSLDADRMDYILRDIYFTGAGTATNAIDVERLVQYVYLDGDELLFDEKAKPFLEGFAIARYNSYKWVYFHHKPLFFTKIARDLLMKIVGSHPYPCLLLKFINGELGNNVELLKITDDYFISLLPELASGNNPIPEAVMLATRKSPYRALWKRDNDYVETMGKLSIWLNQALDKLRDKAGNRLEGIIEHELITKMNCGNDCIKTIIPKFDTSFKALVRGRSGTVTNIWDASPLVRAIDESWQSSPHIFIYVNSNCNCTRESIARNLIDVVKELMERETISPP